MKIRVLLTAVGLASAFAVPAMACTRAPDNAVQRMAYFHSVTSVYVAIAEDFQSANPRYPSDEFTVRMKPVETVWGDPPGQALTLNFTPGACTEWFFDEDDLQAQRINGGRYFVFVAPNGERDPSLIHVEPAGTRTGAEALVRLGHLQMRGDLTPRPDSPVMPEWPPRSMADQTQGPTLPRWLPWVGGASIISLLLGFLIGRGRAARTKKSKTS
ncbi:hypothetical protein [Brevundimonas sp. FT23028]|uniref:hypothetical protein n=1 Tax=Brevundimonas sp. FT23028 TaxID=3393748 RepID=UPI003B5888FD